MARIKQKGKAGAAKNFITRNQAIKKLQVTLADFRRLCILKGIYPREPRNKKKANKGSTAPATFYYTKDIQYLLHEPVLFKFREHKTFARKLSKALGRGDLSTAKRLNDDKPQYTLDHIIKERYPTFVDALRDMDDALSMLFLFASMPQNDKISAATIANCERLCAEFQHYVIRSRSLRKTFLSIKGIYYQADIKGQDVTWLVPYKFSQQVPTDVDFRIMLTFLDFHQTFVGFVNYKLYSELGLVYPPEMDVQKDEGAAGLGAFVVEKIAKNITADEDAEMADVVDVKDTSAQVASLGEKLATIRDRDSVEEEEAPVDEEEVEDDDAAVLDDFTTAAPNADAAALAQPDASVSAPTNLFSPFTFYLSREVPRYSLEFLIKSFGGKVSWDPILGSGSPLEENDPRITHHVCDRPNQEKRFPGRSYLQPQWVYDCINKGRLVGIDEYAPGALLPPHLSPFVKVEEGDYDPEAVPEAEAEEEEEEEDVEEETGMQVADDDDEEEEEEEEAAAAASTIPTVEDSDVDEEIDEHERQLAAEAAGVAFSKAAATKKGSKKPTAQKETKAEKEAREAQDMAKIMMSNKHKKLYAKMQYGIQKKEEATNSLRQKRKAIEKEKRKGGGKKGGN
ncbi:mRNA-binding ribosome synthesis protein nop7 [Saitoella coloradoensis]